MGDVFRESVGAQDVQTFDADGQIGFDVFGKDGAGLDVCPDLFQFAGNTEQSVLIPQCYVLRLQRNADGFLF